MPSSGQPSDRFRPATDFPKQVEDLSRPAVDALYAEMRDCLIFTNRSRGQLLRRNEEHKATSLQLKADVQRLQGLIQQLSTEKQELTERNRAIVSELERELGTMTQRMDELSDAFDTVAQVDDPTASAIGLIAMPGRFLRFVRAVRSIVLWWRSEKPEDSLPARPASAPLPEGDRAEKPQMYDDPASNGRSLLDR